QVTSIYQIKLKYITIKMLLVNHVTTNWDPVAAGCGFGPLNGCSRCSNNPSSTVFTCSLPL
ncbi:unnamed protein product, partial [Bubo scandiacus]